MPYVIKKEDDKWCVYNEHTDEKKACHDTEEKAQAQVNLLHAIENDPGWEPTHDNG